MHHYPAVVLQHACELLGNFSQAQISGPHSHGPWFSRSEVGLKKWHFTTFPGRANADPEPLLRDPQIIRVLKAMRDDTSDDSSFTSILPFTLELKKQSYTSFNPAINFWWLVTRAQRPSAFTQCWKSAAVIERHQPFYSTATQTLWVSSGHNRTIYLISGCVSKPPMELSQNRDAWIPVPEILILSSQLRPNFEKTSQIILMHSCPKLSTYEVWARLSSKASL